MTFSLPRLDRAPAGRSGPRPGIRPIRDQHGAALLPAHAPDEVAFRQLRHHTNNTLQRLLTEIASSELQRSEAGRALIEALQERILVSASIANALFAVTEAPAPLERRLRMLCASLMQLHAQSDQSLQLDVTVTSAGLDAPGLHLPADFAQLVVRVTRELAENALKHGMHARARGCLRVNMVGHHDRWMLSVADNGWGPGEAVATSQGLGLVRELVAPLSGKVSLDRQDGWTMARVILPKPCLPCAEEPMSRPSRAVPRPT